MLPALLWLRYIYTRDIYEPEPRRYVWRVFIWGALSTIPAALVEVLCGVNPLDTKTDVMTLGITAMVIIGPVEELCKFLAVRWTVYSEPEFDEPVDGILYGATASLGFSALENVGYILTIGPSIAIVRALLSTPLHFTVGAMWGAALGRAKFMPRGGMWLVLGGLFSAAAFHGGFDFLLGLQQPWSNAVALLVLLPLLWTTWFHSLRDALAASPYRFGVHCGRCHEPNVRDARFCTSCGAPLTLEPTPCPNCSRPVYPTYDFCVACGRKNGP